MLDDDDDDEKRKQRKEEEKKKKESESSPCLSVVRSDLCMHVVGLPWFSIQSVLTLASTPTSSIVVSHSAFLPKLLVLLPLLLFSEKKLFIPAMWKLDYHC